MAPGALAYYSVVPKDGTARSRVLSCNAEAGAGAGLPEAVSIAELRTWMTACQTDETKRRDIGFDTFILCAQSVADAIDDKRMCQWAKVAAGFLEPRLEKAIQPFKETGERQTRAQQLHDAWPALCALGMRVAKSRPEVELQALVRAVCGLPVLQRLVLMIMHNAGGSVLGGRAAPDKPELEHLLEV